MTTMSRYSRRSRNNVDQCLTRLTRIITRVVMNVSIPFFFLLINLHGSFIGAFQSSYLPHNSMLSVIIINRPKFDEVGIKYSPCHYQRRPQLSHGIASFTKSKNKISLRGGSSRAQVSLFMAGQSPLTEIEVRKGIDKVVSALRKDSRTNQELGKLQRVTTILGSGMQQMDTILAVRFNAAFQKSGPGLSSIPLPFGLGQSNVSEGRGTMVGQVKASINVKSGKVISCSVFRDLGYGRTFDLKV